VDTFILGLVPEEGSCHESDPSNESTLRTCRGGSIRSIFPQELPLLLSLGGLGVVERFGDWSRAPLNADAALQLYICEPD
jgi:hypothetical protein